MEMTEFKEMSQILSAKCDEMRATANEFDRIYEEKFKLVSETEMNPIMKIAVYLKSVFEPFVGKHTPPYIDFRYRWENFTIGVVNQYLTFRILYGDGLGYSINISFEDFNEELNKTKYYFKSIIYRKDEKEILMRVLSNWNYIKRDINIKFESYLENECKKLVKEQEEKCKFIEEISHFEV